MQEHLYHVLENNRVPCSSEVIPPDPNAPELPPPLEPDSQDSDTPPVYQDITELSCKPNKLVDYDKKDQQCQYADSQSATVYLGGRYVSGLEARILSNCCVHTHIHGYTLPTCTTHTLTHKYFCIDFTCSLTHIHLHS